MASDPLPPKGQTVRLSGRVCKGRPSLGSNDFWLEWQGTRLLIDCSILAHPVDWWSLGQVQIVGQVLSFDDQQVVQATSWRNIYDVDLHLQARICQLININKVS